MSTTKNEFFKDIKEEFKELGSKVNKMFDEFVSNDEGGDFKLLVDVFETNDSFVFQTDLPGMQKEDVKLQIRDNQLTISGERLRSSGLGTTEFHKKERKFGTFRRSFSLPEGLDLQGIKAKFELGILTITFPKENVVVKEEKEIKID